MFSMGTVIFILKALLVFEYKRAFFISALIFGTIILIAHAILIILIILKINE